jgi:hypothetical protein
MRGVMQRFSFYVVATLILLVVLSGCGGGGGSTSAVVIPTNTPWVGYWPGTWESGSNHGTADLSVASDGTVSGTLYYEGQTAWVAEASGTVDSDGTAHITLWSPAWGGHYLLSEELGSDDSEIAGTFTLTGVEGQQSKQLTLSLQKQHL